MPLHRESLKPSREDLEHLPAPERRIPTYAGFANREQARIWRSLKRVNVSLPPLKTNKPTQLDPREPPRLSKRFTHAASLVLNHS